MTELPDYGKISFAHSEGFPLEELLPDASVGSVKLLGRLLQLNPGEMLCLLACLCVDNRMCFTVGDVVTADTTSKC